MREMVGSRRKASSSARNRTVAATTARSVTAWAVGPAPRRKKAKPARKSSQSETATATARRSSSGRTKGRSATKPGTKAQSGNARRMSRRLRYIRAGAPLVSSRPGELEPVRVALGVRGDLLEDLAERRRRAPAPLGRGAGRVHHDPRDVERTIDRV